MIYYMILFIGMQFNYLNSETLVNESLEQQIGQDSLLRLNYDNLRYFYNNFNEFENITSVDANYLSNINFDSLFTYLAKLPNLKHLNISRANIENLSPKIALLKNLETLILIGNPIATLPDEFSNLTKLRYLNLTSCHINNLDSVLLTLQPVSSLKEIYLDDLQLLTFPNELFNLKQLQIISVANNQIDFIPKDICNLVNLKYLLVNNNKFDTFPENIACLDLQVLQISTIAGRADSIENAFPKIKTIIWH